LISADGIVLDDPLPPGFRDSQVEAYLADALGMFEACDAMLCARTTYQRFAKMHSRNAEPRPYTARLNAVRKYVFSSKLETAEWSNSTIVRGNVAAEITSLKQQEGGDLLDLLVLGHGVLGQTLQKQGLLDAIVLSIYPS
jgi:dihydrofolate reductase